MKNKVNYARIATGIGCMLMCLMSPWPAGAAPQSLGNTVIATKIDELQAEASYRAHLEAGDIAVLPDGSLLTCWIDADADSPFGEIKIAESTDRGVTFSTPITIEPIPGSDFRFSRPMRFAIASDSSVILAALGHADNDEGTYWSALQLFRREAPHEDWTPMRGSFEEFGGREVRLESMVAVEDGAFLVLSGSLPNLPDQADSLVQQHTWAWWMRDGQSHPVGLSQVVPLPELLAGGCDEAVLWTRGSTIDLFARPTQSRSIWRTRITLPAMGVGLLEEFHRTEPGGRELQIDSLHVALDGEATLACSERWEDAVAMATSKESDDLNAWMSAVHRERILYVGAPDGTFGTPLRTVGSDAGRVSGRVRVLPLPDGWLEVRSRVQLVPEMVVGIDLYRLGPTGEELGIVPLWEDIDANPWAWRTSAPVQWPDNAGAIAMYYRDWNKRPAVETWTLLRFAPPNGLTE